MIYEITTRYSGKVQVKPRVGLSKVKDMMGKERYGIIIDLDAMDEAYPTPFARLTVNFGEFIALKNAAYIDTSNGEHFEELLRQGIAKDTGLTKYGAYSRYPLWIFEEGFLREHGAENYQKYSDSYDEYYREVRGSEGMDEDCETKEIEDAVISF